MPPIGNAPRTVPVVPPRRGAGNAPYGTGPAGQQGYFQANTPVDPKAAGAQPTDTAAASGAAANGVTPQSMQRLRMPPKAEEEKKETVR